MTQVKDQAPATPEKILQIGMGFWASKILLVAVRFELFTRLAGNGPLSAAAIKQALGLQCSDRHLYDFLDTLTGFEFLEREGLLDNARYTNSRNANIFLDKRKHSYMGGILEMANNRLYRNWGSLEEGLLTGLSQNETTTGQEHSFTELYKVPEKLKEFVNAMSGIQAGIFAAFAQQFNFSAYKTLTDAGGSGALLSILVAKQQPQLHCLSFDLPPVEPIAQDNIRQAGVADRVKTASGDFFNGEIPGADIIVMGNILHDWDEEKKLLLMKKAYDALPANGAFVAIENVIDEERKKNVFGMMMSLNMLVQTGKGFDYTFSDFNRWAVVTGYRRTELLPLAGNASAAIAYK